MIFNHHPIKQNLMGYKRFASHNKARSFVLFLILLFSVTNSIAQDLWEDNASVDSIKAGIKYTYNFEFEKAESVKRFVERKYPDHPALLMLEATIQYWQFYPLRAGTTMGDKYESIILKSLDKSEEQLKKNPDHQLTLFCALMPRMMLLEYYADNGLGIRSIPHLTAIYSMLMKSFEYNRTTPDFYFPSGLYNYYIEAYPEANPFYKPFTVFFRSGNKTIGLEELYKCWQLSGFVGPEALYFLTYIYINFETNYSPGVKYAEELSVTYSGNPLFAQYYIQLLLLNKQYKEAESVINRFRIKDKSDFFQHTFDVYHALVEEHYHSNYKNAEELYKSTIASMKGYGSFGNRYTAYAWFGLSRINKHLGQIQEAESDYSEALKFAQYPKVNFN